MTEPSAAAGAVVDAWLRVLVREIVGEQLGVSDAAMARMADAMTAMTREVQDMHQTLRALGEGPLGSAPPPPEPEPPAPAPIVVEPEPSAPVVVTPTPQGGAVLHLAGTAADRFYDLEAMSYGDPVATPMGSCRRAMLEVPAEVVGCTSMRLVVDRYGLDRPAYDIWFRNDISMRPGAGPASYSVRVVLNGREVRHQDVPKHHQYRGWGRLVSAGPLPPLPWPDAATLRVAGVPNYSGPLDASVVDRYAAAMASWSDDPFDPRGLHLYMPGVGGRDDIGPTTRPSAAALVSRDERLRAYVIGQAEAAGTIPWHHWDAERGTWMRVTDWPRLWTDGRGGEPGRGTLLQPVPSPAEVGWELDTSHQPDASFVAYLLTGRRAFLDNLQAQAAWNVVAQWPDPRGDSDMLVVNRNQVRGAAWGLRQIDEAAWASPEGSAEKAYFSKVSEANWSWIVGQIPAWTKMQGEAHGWLPGEYGTEGALPPWQQDYFANVAIASAKRGNPHALTFLKWARNFLVGRFDAKALGHDGAAYLLAISEKGRVFNTWAEIKAKTAARKWSNGAGWATVDGDYAAWARATLAGLADVLGDAEARRLYDWLPAEGAPFTKAADYQRDPLLSIAPAE